MKLLQLALYHESRPLQAMNHGDIVNLADQPLFDFRIGLLLRQAHRRAATAFTRALEPLGIDGRDFGVLLLLDTLGVATQKQLIDRLGSDKASMVRTIDRLEAQGFLTRDQSPTNRRAQDVRLTDAGRRTYASAQEEAQRVVADLFVEFSRDERQQLMTLLDRFVRAERSAERGTRPT
jgi:DNA-binding MarR family transcriptional regulator